VTRNGHWVQVATFFDNKLLKSIWANSWASF